MTNNILRGIHGKNRFQKSNFLRNLALTTLVTGAIVASYFPAKKIYDEHKIYQGIVNGPTVNYSIQKGDNITNLCKKEIEAGNYEFVSEPKSKQNEIEPNLYAFYNLNNIKISVDACRDAVYDINKTLDLLYSPILQPGQNIKIPDLNNDGKIGF
ncbi:MAG: hypothetical protein WC413_00925 [Candidatus Nanoarchaeia archaeon]